MKLPEDAVVESYTVVCDAVGCLVYETIKNMVAAAAAFDGGPGWTADPIWFPADWRAVHVTLNAAVKRIYGTARISEILRAAVPDGSQGDSLWTFTLCPLHRDADPVIRDMRPAPMQRDDDGKGGDA